MLSLASPWALAAAALAAWLLWRARQSRVNRTHTVSNLFLWTGGRATSATASLPDRPQPPWLVWLQALALVAIAFAASGPAQRPPHSDAALVIDLSRSMAARDGGGTRLDQARAAARTWLSQRPSGARIAIVTAGAQPRQIGAFRAGDAAIAAALATLKPDDAAADFAGAVSLARAATIGEVAVIADAAPPPQNSDVALEWLRVGSPADNVGIVSLRSGGPGHALVEVQNFGAASQSVSLALDRDGRELWRQPVTLAPGSSRTMAPTIPDGTTTVTARLNVDDAVGDALSSDNTLTADVSPRPRIHVRLVTPGSRYLEAALRALPDVALDIVATLPSASPADTVIVCDRCATVPRRPSLWLPAATDAGAEDAPLAVMRADHALLRGVDVSDVRVSTTSAPAGSSDVLATAAGRAAVIASEEAAGRQVVLAVDLERSSLPLSVAFPVLVSNTIEWLANRTPAALDRATLDAVSESDLRQPPVAPIEPLLFTPSAHAPSWLVAVAMFALSLVAIEWAVRRRRPWARVIAGVMLAGAIAGARTPGCASGRTVVFAIDGSGSVAAVRRGALARVEAEMSAMSSDDRAGLVAFGDRAERLRAVDASRSLDGVTLPAASAATNLAAGIDAARLLLPVTGDRRIVVLTDGQPTVGDTLQTAQSSGTPIDVIPLDDRRAPVIRRLDAPIESRSDAAIPLRADIEGAPGTRAAIDLLRDGTAIGTRAITIDATGHASASWTDVPTHAGVVFYRATATDPRLGITVSEAGAGVTVGGRSRVLVVTDHAGDVARRFSRVPVDVDERAVSAMPDTRSTMRPYAAIVLDAIAPHRMNARQLDAISDAVALDGTGLLVLGDRDSLNASDYAASRFSDSLPIDFTALPRPPSATMALALLVDTSGSMASTSDGVTKISAAREAVSRALAVVPAGDVVEVIGFSAAPTVIVPAGEPRDTASVAERLRTMTPGGGTALAPALTLAMTWLRGVSNPVRRVLLVSDGRTTPADGDAARAAVSGQSIEVSVVAIGSDADRTWLTNLARSTGGRAYFPDTLRELPLDVAREAARGASGREIDERFRVRAGAHALAPATPPELGGYVAGQLRPGAASAWKSSTEDPVLAAWPRGLGRVAVFASDLRGNWGAPLASWPESPAFWTRALTWLARGADESGADAQLETTAAGTRLVVDTGTAATGSELSSINAAVLTPSGTTMTVLLHFVTPTRAEAALPLADTGDYRATIVITDPRSGHDTRFMRGWFWSGDLEAQARGANVALLQEIAARSGGHLKIAGPAPASNEGVFDGTRTRSSRDAAVALLLLAAALLFWDYWRALSPEAHR